MKLKKRYFIIAILIIIFIVLLMMVLSRGILNIDRKAIDLVASIRTPFLTTFFKLITKLCNATFLIILTAILLVFWKDEKEKVFIPINLGAIALLNFILKMAIKRNRPTDMLIKQGGYAFPSGHAMLSVAFYGFLCYLIYRQVKNKALRIVLLIIMSLLILLIGFSRIYLGVHYLSDVLAGYLLGLIYLIVFIEVKEKMKNV